MSCKNDVHLIIWNILAFSSKFLQQTILVLVSFDRSESREYNKNLKKLLTHQKFLV